MSLLKCAPQNNLQVKTNNLRVKANYSQVLLETCRETETTHEQDSSWN